MADSHVDIANPSGNADTRTEATNGNFRQVVVLGDPSTNAAVATVTDSAPSASDYGLVVGIHPDSVNANGQSTMSGSAPVAIASDQSVIPAGGAVAHDAADSGNPIKMGFKAVAHGTNPTAVAAADRTDWYANRAGVPFVMGGHPNVITRSNKVLASDGAQTDAALLSVSAGTKIVVTQISAVCDAANSVNVAVRIGLGVANVPAAALAGTNGLLLEGTYAAGGGLQKGNAAGILAVGADAEDLRLTCGSPTGGALYVTYSYYTIES